MSGYNQSSAIPQIVTSSASTDRLAPPQTPVTASLGPVSNSEQQIRLQILASLFPPNSPNGSYIAHLKTWEDVPGAPAGSQESKKPRYILLAVQSDGQVKIHKSKRNTNGTFSIGKTWALGDLRALEVHKPHRNPSSSSSSGSLVTCFTITINAKSYLWETESSRQQDDFLVTLVRSFRQLTRGQSPRLVGFQVGEIPGAPPAYEVPAVSGGVAAPAIAASLMTLPPGSSMEQRRPSASSSSPSSSRPPTSSQQQQRPPPNTATSFKSNESSHYLGAGGVAQSLSSQSLSLPTTTQPPPPQMMPHSVSSSSFASGLGDQSAPSRSMPTSIVGGGGGSSSGNAMRPTTPSQQGRQQPQNTSGNASISVSPATKNRVLDAPGGGGLPSSSVSLSPSSASTTLPRLHTQQQGSESFSSTTPASGTSKSPLHPGGTTPLNSRDAGKDALDEATAAANAATLLGQRATSGSRMMDESDVMLTNVEEMLEGLEWGAHRSTGRGAGGQGPALGQGSADQVEKRLLGELHALEAAGIHAIIESDDRVIDVVKYLDNALAEVDRMDQMLSMYKSHLNTVADDIKHIEAQNEGLQVQSSNQNALLAELDRLLLAR